MIKISLINSALAFLSISGLTVGNDILHRLHKKFVNTSVSTEETKKTKKQRDLIDWVVIVVGTPYALASITSGVVWYCGAYNSFKQYLFEIDTKIALYFWAPHNPKTFIGIPSNYSKKQKTEPAEIVTEPQKFDSTPAQIERHPASTPTPVVDDHQTASLPSIHKNKQPLRTSPPGRMVNIPLPNNLGSLSTITVTATYSGDENYYLADRVANNLGALLSGQRTKNSPMKIMILSVGVEPSNTGDPCDNEYSQWSVTASVELNVTINAVPESGFPSVITGTKTICGDDYYPGSEEEAAKNEASDDATAQIYARILSLISKG